MSKNTGGNKSGTGSSGNYGGKGVGTGTRGK